MQGGDLVLETVVGLDYKMWALHSKLEADEHDILGMGFKQTK